MAADLNTKSLVAYSPKQTKHFFDLSAELRNTFYTAAFSTYSGHINIISRRDHERGYSRQAALGPLALLLLSKRVESEIRKMMFWHFTVFMPPRLPSLSFKKLTSNITLRSIIVDLDTYKSSASLIMDLGELGSLEELEIRTSYDDCWSTLLSCLNQPDSFPQLRTLKVVNLRLLGRRSSTRNSPRRLIKDRQIVPEIFAKAILGTEPFEDFYEWGDELEFFLVDAENLLMALESDCPDRKLDVCVWPSLEHDTQICAELDNWYHCGEREATMRRLNRAGCCGLSLQRIS